MKDKWKKMNIYSQYGKYFSYLTMHNNVWKSMKLFMSWALFPWKV